MRILRGILLGLSILFLLATIGMPFGVSFSMRGWYLGDAQEKMAEVDKKIDTLKMSAGGKVPAALEKQIEEQQQALGVAKSIATWELAMIPLSLFLVIALFLSKRA